MPRAQTIVFAGGGHAHLYSLLRTGDLVRQGFDVVLVNPSRYLYYSGMATGVISRTYTTEEDRIDVRRLVERGGGHFVEGRIEKVIPKDRELLLESGERISYDAASFCLGSEAPVESISGGSAENGRVLPVKPVENTAKIRDSLLAPSGGTGPRVLVVGGGAAGCEVAANTANLLRQEGKGGRVTLAESGPALLKSSPKKARREMSAYLGERGVEVLLVSRVVSYKDGVARLETGREMAAGLLIPAVGIVPSPVFRRSGLVTGDDGGLWVDHYLRAVGDGRLFGGGDSVCFRGEALPRLGVFAIRQGPVLFHNLQAVLKGEPLQTFEPQKRYLYILNFGDGSGLGIYGSLTWRGRSAMWLKNKIDKRFMAGYSQL
ncbi:MAG: NAD(P)/FAD-dependent oxidoreductase [Rubrobacteraceae bacterium]